jgi:hypothetical protein
MHASSFSSRGELVYNCPRDEAHRDVEDDLLQFGLPVHRKDVTRPVATGHLVPWVPRSSWDGWFAIAIFPESNEVRWLKAHFFHQSCRPGFKPLAAVEGFGPRSEALITWGTTEESRVQMQEVDTDGLKSSLYPTRVELEGHFLLEGTSPRYTMAFKLPEHDAEASFDFETGWPIWWSRWGRVLNYVGQHSRVRVTLDSKGTKREMDGFGVMEHVCGISMPFDFTRFLPFHYHWDVLAFGSPDSPFDSSAGLSIGRNGNTVIRLRSAAKLPRRAPEAMRGLSVRYLEARGGSSADGEDIAVPVRWEGSTDGRDGRLSYEASASTPLAGIIPGGGMLGFTFEGEWKPASGSSSGLTGTGFTEYGDFSGGLAPALKPG